MSEHGTRSRYVRGCRCEPCSGANRDYARSRYVPRVRADKKVPAEARFWPKVDRRGPNECWPWLGNKNSLGYGSFAPDWHRPTVAHRVAYELVVGPIPEGLVLDHLCRNPSCVNPAHLEPVTQRENLRRGVGPTGRKARQTHCVHGHPFDEANTYRASNGTRHCRACFAIRNRRRRRAAAG